MDTKSYDAAVLAANRGHFSHALELLKQPEKDQPRSSSRELALKAEMLQYTGDNETASRVAQSLVSSRDLHHSLSTRCLAVLGLCAFEAGHLRRASNYFQKAIRLGEDAGDQEGTCHSLLCLLGSLADVSTPSAVASLVSEAQRCVRRVGSPTMTVRLHLILGRTEGRRGLLDEADRHMSAARSLLDASPNPWLEGLQSLDASVLSHLRADFSDSIHLADQALMYSLRSGHERTRFAALANLGSLHLYRGDLQKAEDLFRQSSQAACGISEVDTALLDGYAQLKLARNQLSECESFLDVTVVLNSLPES